MVDGYLIGLDFGTESARGVLIDSASGRQEGSLSCPYRYGVMTKCLPDGTDLPPAYALQRPDDYLEVAETILRGLGNGRRIIGIGVDFTASSPLPALFDGTPLARLRPECPHAYVKLWKHAAAQRYADAINRRGGAYLRNFGGKLSGEWLLAKAAQIREEAPEIWAKTDRFVEAGDWLVWQLGGREGRSLNFAAYKAQYQAGVGYPGGVVPGLLDRLAPPLTVGNPVGELTAAWRERTGIEGPAIIAVAAIDSHAVVPAVRGGWPRTLIGALGTSAAYLYFSDRFQPLPDGIEGVAEDAALPGFWGYEAGQPAFGDVLSWFVRTFPLDADQDRNFAAHNAAAQRIRPGSNALLALDWWSGNRVPFADSSLSGLLIGLNLQTSGAGIYRALIEGLCFGTRAVVDLLAAGKLPTERLILTSGLAQRNPLVVQTMADVTGLIAVVPRVENATCVGAAIHGAVAAGLVADFEEGQARFGADAVDRYEPNEEFSAIYDDLYAQYRNLSETASVRAAMRSLSALTERAYLTDSNGRDEPGHANETVAGVTG